MWQNVISISHYNPVVVVVFMSCACYIHWQYNQFQSFQVWKVKSTCVSSTCTLLPGSRWHRIWQHKGPIVWSEKMFLLVTWFTTSVKSFLMTLWFQSQFGSLRPHSTIFIEWIMVSCRVNWMSSILSFRAWLLCDWQSIPAQHTGLITPNSPRGPNQYNTIKPIADFTYWKHIVGL